MNRWCLLYDNLFLFSKSVSYFFVRMLLCIYGKQSGRHLWETFWRTPVGNIRICVEHLWEAVWNTPVKNCLEDAPGKEARGYLREQCNVCARMFTFSHLFTYVYSCLREVTYGSLCSFLIMYHVHVCSIVVTHAPAWARRTTALAERMVAWTNVDEDKA